VAYGFAPSIPECESNIDDEKQHK